MVKIMNTIKNTFKKFPLTSLIVTHFVVVWLVPIILTLGLKFNVVWFSVLNFWRFVLGSSNEIPGVFNIYSGTFDRILNSEWKYLVPSSDPYSILYFYTLFLAPFLVFFTMWVKKKITGILTKKDIFWFIFFCSVVPVLYTFAYIYIYGFSGANFIL